MNFIEKKHRIGLLVPSSNSTQEPEFIQMLPALVSLHVTRLTLRRIDPESTVNIVAELEKESRKLDRKEADAVFLACGNWWTASIVEDLEQAIGKPVLTTNNMTVWHALKKIGVEEGVRGYGRLLREMKPLGKAA